MMNKNEAFQEQENALVSFRSMLDKDTKALIHEILKMDRLLYLNIIREKGHLTSLQMTREILALSNNLKPEEVKAKKVADKNPNINKRLKDLADLGILIDSGGEYSLSSIGPLVIDDLTKLNSNIEVLRRYRQFFDTHDYSVIPPQQFQEIYRLCYARQCENAIEYYKEIEDNTARTDRRIRIATEYLHDVPGWILEELKQGNLSLQLMYQFIEPFKMNSDDEKELRLWKDLTEETFFTVELRYITLEDRNPIGIRIIDRKWAILNLLELAENKLNRPKSFCGVEEKFVSWVEDIFSYIWNTSESLPIDKIT